MDSRTNGLCRGGLLTDKAIFHQPPRVSMCQIFTTGGRQGNVNSVEALAVSFRTSNTFQTLGNKYFRICLFCLILRATQIKLLSQCSKVRLPCEVTADGIKTHTKTLRAAGAARTFCFLSADRQEAGWGFNWQCFPSSLGDQERVLLQFVLIFSINPSVPQREHWLLASGHVWKVQWPHVEVLISTWANMTT